MKLFVKALSHLDASLWCPRNGLSGASWWVDLQLEAPQASDGMILDFGRVKPWAKQELDAGADHTLLVPLAAAGVAVTRLENQRLRVTTTQPYAMTLEGPASAFTLLPLPEITATALADWLTEQLNPRLPLAQGQLGIQLREEAISGAAFHYSHGLRLHDGNCQRIAHGHRSRLDICRNGQPAPEIARQLAARWDHAYLYDRTDLQQGDARQRVIGYQAGQGTFSISLPAQLAHELPGPTTVENLAQFLADQLSAEYPQDHWEVCLCEGINKGAVATAG